MGRAIMWMAIGAALYANRYDIETLAVAYYPVVVEYSVFAFDWIVQSVTTDAS